MNTFYAIVSLLQACNHPIRGRMKNIVKTMVSLVLVMLSFGNTWAQTPSLELYKGSGASNSVANFLGPKILTFGRNVNNPNDNNIVAYPSPLTATFTIENEKYTTVPGCGTTVYGFSYGTTGGDACPQAALDFSNAYVGAAKPNYFSTTSATLGQGLSLTDNYAMRCYLIADALSRSQVPPGTKDVYFADMVITFSKPVNNPIFHISGLGGAVGSKISGWQLGYSARMTLLSNKNYTLTRLSGSTYFTIEKDSIIRNSSAFYGPNADGSGDYYNSASGATGSVMVNGTGITSIRFKVSMDTDIGVNATANTTYWWDFPNAFNSEGFNVSVSLADIVKISGNVFHDANGLTDNMVNGPGTNVGGTLYAIIYDNTFGKIAASIPVNSDGTYVADNLPAGENYSVIIHTTNYNPGPSGCPASKLPAGWISTGEKFGTGAGHDGFVNGSLILGIIDSDVTDVNFGIEQPPVATGVTASLPNQPAVGTIITLNSTIDGVIPPPGSDAEDGDDLAEVHSTLVIKSVPANATLLYNGLPVTVGRKISNFDANLLQVELTSATLGSSGTSFDFAYTDAAGITSNTASYIINWPTPLPVSLLSFETKISNNKVLLKWTTSAEFNSKSFDAERSSNGLTWNTIGSMKAAGQSKNVNIDYNFADNAPLKGDNYYRLKMIDIDGKFTYTEVRMVTFGANSAMSISPNPTNGIVYVHNINGNALIKVYDQAGRSVLQQSVKGASGSNIAVDLSHLPATVYIMQIVAESETPVTFKVIKK